MGGRGELGFSPAHLLPRGASEGVEFRHAHDPAKSEVDRIEIVLADRGISKLVAPAGGRGKCSTRRGQGSKSASAVAARAPYGGSLPCRCEVAGQVRRVQLVSRTVEPTATDARQAVSRISSAATLPVILYARLRVQLVRYNREGSSPGHS